MDGLTDGWMDGHTDISWEFLPILQDFVPYWGRCLSQKEDPMLALLIFQVHRLKRGLSKAGVNMVTRSGTKLKDLWSAKTTKHDPLKKTASTRLNVLALKNPNKLACCFITRGNENGSAANRGNWSHSYQANRHTWSFARIKSIRPPLRLSSPRPTKTKRDTITTPKEERLLTFTAEDVALAKV